MEPVCPFPVLTERKRTAPTAVLLRRQTRPTLHSRFFLDACIIEPPLLFEFLRPCLTKESFLGLLLFGIWNRDEVAKSLALAPVGHGVKAAQPPVTTTQYRKPLVCNGREQNCGIGVAAFIERQLLGDGDRRLCHHQAQRQKTVPFQPETTLSRALDKVVLVLLHQERDERLHLGGCFHLEQLLA